MNKEQIEEIISNYSKLNALAKSKIKLIEEIDSQYDTARGIEDIEIDLHEVCVRCNDSCRGHYDYFIYTFPTEWLSKSDSELQEIVLNEKKLREERELRKKEEKRLEENRKKEQMELELYEKLKVKFNQ